MPSDVTRDRRCLDQEIAIDRLMREAQALRDENADLVAQLTAARGIVSIAAAMDRLEATLPVGPGAPATARAALTTGIRAVTPRAARAARRAPRRVFRFALSRWFRLVFRIRRPEEHAGRHCRPVGN